MVNFLVNTMV